MHNGYNIDVCDYNSVCIFTFVCVCVCAQMKQRDGGGVGLCEMVQHLSYFDYICVSGTTENRIIEYVDHLHEHFVSPAEVESGHYKPPSSPGYSCEMKQESIQKYLFPDGPAW